MTLSVIIKIGERYGVTLTTNSINECLLALRKNLSNSKLSDCLYDIKQKCISDGMQIPTNILALEMQL
jgi:hypothetical protein